MNKIITIFLFLWGVIFPNSSYAQDQCCIGDCNCGPCFIPTQIPIYDSTGMIIGVTTICIPDPCCIDPCFCICCEPPCDGGPDVQGPIDPNDLIPPASVGDQGWIRRDQELPFRVLFENLPAATLAAQQVVIVVPLMANVDYGSFRLGEVGFGDYYSPMPPGTREFDQVLPVAAQFGVDVRVLAGIDTATGVAQWIFQSLDPDTGEPPLDPLAGFLPPNIPDQGNGEGFANFSILPDPAAQTYDQIDFMADIVFDENEPIATPMALLTIDADAPISTVSPAVTAPDAQHLRLHWSGTDVGSGLDHYTLFGSDNGAPYVPWLVETDTSSGLLPAVEGHTYRILCVARDSVRNAEQKTQHDLEVVFQRWFADADGDGYGTAGAEAGVGSAAPAGYVADTTDCNDANPAIHPNATEICNGFDDNCDGLSDLADPNVQDDSLARAAVKVYLQGPYVSALQLMHDSLRVKNLIPLTEPYTGLTGFTHTGGGGEQTTPAVLAVTGLDAIVDWVFLELRGSANPAQVLATRSALVQRDGDVVDVDGISPVSFNVLASQSFFITVRHRNHLGVQLGAAVFYPDCDPLETDFTATPPEGFYDFNGLNAAQKTVSGKFVLWAGNGRVDFQLKYNGSNNDRTTVLAVVGLATPNAVVPGYNLNDYNLDGLVKYNGSANDRNVLLGNVGIVTPSAVVWDQTAR